MDPEIDGGWLRFSSAALPERDRFSYFRDEFFRFMVALDINLPRGDVFDGAVEMARYGEAEVGHTTSTTGEYVRTKELIADGRDKVYAIVCTSGALRSTQGDTERLIRPGEAVVCDTTQVGGLYLEGKSGMWAVGVDRARIQQLLPALREVGGTPLSNTQLSIQLLFSYLQQLRSAGPLDDTTAATCGAHMIDLFALSLGGANPDLRNVTRGGLRAARLARLLREVEIHASEPDLNAQRLAGLLGVSPRYVHMLFEDTGRSLSEHLTGRRLETAAAMLQDPAMKSLRIADIASLAGFTDLSHFNRSFRRKFGDTPSGVRSRS